MRIAQVTPRYRPFIGGVEMVVEKLATGMAQKGHRVEVLTLDPAGNLPGEEELDGVLVRRFPTRGIYDYAPELGRHLATRGHRHDVVHAHGLHTFVPPVVAQARQQGGRFPLVITGHYHGRGKTRASTLLLRLYRPGAKRFLRAVDQFICVSGFEAGLLGEHFQVPAEKVTVIPNGVEIQPIVNARPLADQDPCLLVVSRLERYKNIHLAIRALEHLDPGLKLVIIGDGPDRARLEKTAQKAELQGRVLFLGRLGKSELHQWYQTCSLVLNLSDLEAFGLTVLEGLAAGKPVLVNNRTALRELAGRLEGVTAVDAAGLSAPALAAAALARQEAPFQAPGLQDYGWPAVVEKVLGCYAGVTRGWLPDRVPAAWTPGGGA